MRFLYRIGCASAIKIKGSEMNFNFVLLLTFIIFVPRKVRRVLLLYII